MVNIRDIIIFVFPLIVMYFMNRSWHTRYFALDKRLSDTITSVNNNFKSMNTTIQTVNKSGSRTSTELTKLVRKNKHQNLKKDLED